MAELADLREDRERKQEMVQTLVRQQDPFREMVTAHAELQAKHDTTIAELHAEPLEQGAKLASAEAACDAVRE